MESEQPTIEITFAKMGKSHSLSGQDSSVSKSLDLQSKDCRFGPHCRWGGFLVWAFSKPLTPNCLRGFGSPR